MKTCPCETVGTKIDNVLGLLAQGNVIVEFGRKSVPRRLSIMKQH